MIDYTSPRLNLAKVSFNGNNTENRSARVKVPKLSLKIPNASPQQFSLSKNSSSFTKKFNDYQLSAQEDYFPILLTNQSERSHYQRSTRTAAHSRKQTVLTEAVHSSEKRTTILSTETQTARESTSDVPLERVINSMKKFAHMDDKTTILADGVRRAVQIRAAKRIMAALVTNLRALRIPKARSIILGSPIHRDQSNEMYILMEGVSQMINELISCCNRGITARRSKAKLDAIMKEMNDITQKSENAELGVCILYLQAKIYIARNEYTEAIDNLRQYKAISVATKLIGNMLKACKCLGKCYLELKNYKTSLYYFTKFLQVAWYLSSGKHELLAYDYIGLQYYYLGQLDKAHHYHTKMVGGNLEPDNSNVKQIGIGKIKLSVEKHIYQAGRHRRRETVKIKLTKNTKDLHDEDDLDDVSSREEDFELPITSIQKKEDKTEEIYRDIQMHSARERRTFSETDFSIQSALKKKKTARVVAGLMKAKVAQLTKEKEKERRREIIGEGKKEVLSARGLDKTKSLAVKIVPILPSHIKAKPSEPIIVSHLSRNRQLKNFTVSKTSDVPFNPLEDEPMDWKDAVDMKSMEKIKKVLEKFKLNLLVVKQTLQSFECFL